jgi:hypothetical protein
MHSSAAASTHPPRSTGPRGPEGKEISSRNATRHGCCSQRLLLPDEDPGEWEALRASWLKEYITSSPVAVQRECRFWSREHCKLYEKCQCYVTTAERAFDSAERLRRVDLRKHMMSLRKTWNCAARRLDKSETNSRLPFCARKYKFANARLKLPCPRRTN